MIADYNGECIVVVNAFVVHGPNREGCDAQVRLEQGGGIADDVLDEYRIVEGLHGDMAFVRAFEQGIDRGGPGAFRDFDQFLDPDQLATAARAATEDAAHPYRFPPSAAGIRGLLLPSGHMRRSGLEVLQGQSFRIIGGFLAGE